MKLYTRGGDEGMTGLFGGARVSKANPRLDAYGTLDELNAVVGVLALHLGEPGAAARLPMVQSDLFVLGAVLATPAGDRDRLEGRMTRTTWSVPDMEADIDRLSALAEPMRAFVLPGGAPGSAHAHLARTVCRRAEREVVHLAASESLPPWVVIYLNRLSDWFFALARAENAVAGRGDVEWRPLA
jgi:cob(I)alamin adenosyltransferase